ncbi:MAG: FAD-binding oxidoreductase [Dehalococcoidales bacterium]|nr:FAD-binding oxidoreductase [Dehalococcoidales bacterium]
MIENELLEIVGKDNVLDNPEILKEYSGDCSFIPAKTPSCVVKPANVEELQSVVKWANKKHVPLVPVSSGAPHFRGDTVPGADGAVVVDLRRMKKIIRVNRANRVAIIEPGVTFGELQAELAKEGLSAYLPLAPRSTKSVLSSVLEREPITMPGIHFDSTDPMLCTEIVFGSGDKMRTGEAAGPDTLEQQWEVGKAQISPFGPTQMDPQRLVSGAQGTIGIVTWMSIKCRFVSEISRAFLVPSDSLDPLIQLMYRLTRIRFTGNIFIINKVNLACLLGSAAQEIADLSSKLPTWLMFVSCEGYGPLPEEKVQYLEDDLKELAGTYNLKTETAVGGIKADDLAAILPKPSDEPYWKMRLKGGFDEVFFLTTQGKTPGFARMMNEIAPQQGYPVENIGVYIQPVAQGTSCHCEFDFYYDPSNQSEAEKTRKIAAETARKMEAAGAFFSRPYKELAEVAYLRSADTAEMQKKVKGIFDPNGILNPGKLCF